MTVSLEVIRLHLDYSSWATARLVEVAAQLSSEDLNLDFHTADKSVLGTLVHVFIADDVWLARIEGRSNPRLGGPEDHDLTLLRIKWPELHNHWKVWAAGLTDETVRDACSYNDLKGNPHRQPVWQIVLHVANHATHHRGQVAGFLRAMNKKPPVLDLIAFYRETMLG